MIKEDGSTSPNNSRSFSANTKKLSTKLPNRPATPHINLFSAEKGGNNNRDLNSSRIDPNTADDIKIRSLKRGNESENIIKNFSAFMKQIIETKNENFLSGDVRVIEFIISKYLNIPISEVNSIEKLSIRINTDFGLLNQFGEYLHNLKELKLNNSVLTGISEIGTNFRNLKVLQVCNCNMKDLSGIICYGSLEVLEAVDNQISDLIELEMCSSIKRLNLKNNMIADDENIQFLGNMSDLKWLNLNGNPITKLENYSELIKQHIASLEVLDEDSNMTYLNQLTDKNINTENTEAVDQSISTATFTTCSSPEIENGLTARNFTSSTKSFARANRFDEVFDVPPEEKTVTAIHQNEPWKFPENQKYDFSANVLLSKPPHTRGKSQCQINGNKISKKRDSNLKFNAPTGTGLKPVIVKKEAPKEMRSFKKSIDEELANEANEIIKNIDKSKLATSKGFMSSMGGKHNIEDKAKGNNPGLSLKNSLLLGSKELKPMKLRVKQEIGEMSNPSNSSQTH